MEGDGSLWGQELQGTETQESSPSPVGLGVVQSAWGEARARPSRDPTRVHGGSRAPGVRVTSTAGGSWTGVKPVCSLNGQSSDDAQRPRAGSQGGAGPGRQGTGPPRAGIRLGCRSAPSSPPGPPPETPPSWRAQSRRGPPSPQRALSSPALFPGPERAGSSSVTSGAEQLVGRCSWPARGLDQQWLSLAETAAPGTCPIGVSASTEGAAAAMPFLHGFRRIIFEYQPLVDAILGSLGIQDPERQEPLDG